MKVIVVKNTSERVLFWEGLKLLTKNFTSNDIHYKCFLCSLFIRVFLHKLTARRTILEYYLKYQCLARQWYFVDMIFVRTEVREFMWFLCYFRFTQEDFILILSLMDMAMVWWCHQYQLWLEELVMSESGNLMHIKLILKDIPQE